MRSPSLPARVHAIAAAAGALIALAVPPAAGAQTHPVGRPTAAVQAPLAAGGADIPALTGRWAALRTMPTDQRERWALQEDVEAGRVDQLALVNHIARATGAGPLPIPPGARYDRECSRRLGAGSAVFTFGMEMNPEARALIEQRIAAQRAPRTGMQELEAMDRTQRALEGGEQGAVLRGAEAFLRRRGYRPSNNSNDHLIQADVWVRVTPAGRERPDVVLMSLMSYPKCQDLLPTGPAVHLSVGG